MSRLAVELRSTLDWLLHWKKKYQWLKSPVSFHSGFMLKGGQHVKDVDASVNKAVNACIEELIMFFWGFAGHDRDKAGLESAKSGGD